MSLVDKLVSLPNPIEKYKVRKLWLLNKIRVISLHAIKEFGQNKTL